jgi:hypothetical protein
MLLANHKEENSHGERKCFNRHWFNWASYRKKVSAGKHALLADLWEEMLKQSPKLYTMQDTFVGWL